MIKKIFKKEKKNNVKNYNAFTASMQTSVLHLQS